MPRIRTIKPDFCMSQSMSRCSYGARLTFILLWPFADDSGRARGASRALASTLYPYDEDAPRLIEGWLSELEAVGAIVRYKIEGDDYLYIPKFLVHQKIDNPSKSKFPPPPGPSIILASPRRALAEPSIKIALDQGSRIKDQGKDDSASATPDSESARDPEPTPPDAATDPPGIRVLKAIGLHDHPSWFGNAARVTAWLSSGADLELDILPTVQRVMASRGDQGPPRSLSYFDGAIADALATRTRPLPAGNANSSNHRGAKPPLDVAAFKARIAEKLKTQEQHRDAD